MSHLRVCSVLFVLSACAPEDDLGMIPDDAEIIDVSIDFETFAALADENGLWDVDLDEDGMPIDEDLALLPSTCSIASSATLRSATATEGSPSTKTAACYGYNSFPGDSESDCYIKYTSYWKVSSYLYDDTNTCARTADAWYGHALAAYTDPASSVYLRLDRKWCAYSNCEDGFQIGR